MTSDATLIAISQIKRRERLDMVNIPFAGTISMIVPGHAWQKLSLKVLFQIVNVTTKFTYSRTGLCAISNGMTKPAS